MNVCLLLLGPRGLYLGVGLLTPGATEQGSAFSFLEVSQER